MINELHILGISGSLRKRSYNLGLLRAASEVMPDSMWLEIADLSQIPLYNEDDFLVAMPEAVARLKEQIRAADGILIATPEYNHSIPGVLKNAIDWASRPMKSQTFTGKPLAMMGAGGRSGTVTAQGHLREIAGFLGVQILTDPEVAIQRAWEKFDADGNLVDDDSRQLVRDQMAAFKSFILAQGEKEVVPVNPG